MRAFKLNERLFWLLLAVSLGTSIVPSRLLADDNEASKPPAKPAPAKPDSPAPLTERERWMLDRMEQLEKRVAELESKGNPPVIPGTEVSPLQPTSPNPSASSLPSGAAAATSSAVASANVIPAEKVVALGTAQATEKGKSGGVKATASEPFSFADF